MEHWSENHYWTDALDRYYQLRATGQKQIAIDLDEVERTIFDGDGPAYRLLTAMQSVAEHEGQDGLRGAPRLVLALLAALKERGSDNLAGALQK